MGIQFKKVNHVYKTIGQSDDAIIDIDLTISKTNEIIAICGETGSGKSTLVQHMNALLLPTDGQINILNQVIRVNAKKKIVRNLETLKMLDNQFNDLIIENYSLSTQERLQATRNQIIQVLEKQELNKKIVATCYRDYEKVLQKLELREGQKVNEFKRRTQIKELELLLARFVFLDLTPHTENTVSHFQSVHENAIQMLNSSYPLRHEISTLSKTLVKAHKNLIFIQSNKKIRIKRKQKLNPLRQKVGLVFQFPEYQLFEETVLADIAFGPKNFNSTKKEATTKALASAQKVGIAVDLLDKSPFNLSGGQMRKVAIAGILAMEPDILVLDEPTRGLDPKTRDEIMEVFLKINRDENKTIVFITHDMDLVSKYAKRVVVLKDGKIAYDGDKEALFTNVDFSEYGLALPSPLKILRELAEKIGFPYKPQFDIPELINYLEEVLDE